MELIRRKNTFKGLGRKLNNLDKKQLKSIKSRALAKNPWFTDESIQLSIRGIINYLEEDKIDVWLEKYNVNQALPKKVGVVMAGNIPMVGVHDLICVLISGNHLVAKLSSQDEVLIPFIVDLLCDIDPEIQKYISFVDQLGDIDAVIATGSDNTSRYFDYYFSRYPNIIRKNRTSVAILDGEESKEDLKELAHDIFSYFGLGCRNVSKIFMPEGTEMRDLIPHFQAYSHLHDHPKYHNNYYYNKSILLVNLAEHLDSGFALFQENTALSSPISMIYYEYYKDINQLKTILDPTKHKIQCITTKSDEIKDGIPFGKAQKPELWDYADNIDTMDFLLNLNN